MTYMNYLFIVTIFLSFFANGWAAINADAAPLENLQSKLEKYGLNIPLWQAGGKLPPKIGKEDQYAVKAKISTPPPLLKPWKIDESEAERAERIHEAFEKMLTFVNIAGQVEDYVASQMKTVVKKMSTLVESEEDTSILGKSRKCH